ncbi:protein O-mannosyl-transferase TMTC4-like [Schistocerca serialis cubense]|uniref:protein O-mannosyl-transferase TMTC4-like n=1 Tax=Schistocerca serialis cubense TaxID=2023355 RepID=UPI00214E4C3E|nr:protein O-mannosyl-transferase TMTC4-like [Schistocerca serialis cubense]
MRNVNQKLFERIGDRWSDDSDDDRPKRGSRRREVSWDSGLPFPKLSGPFSAVIVGLVAILCYKNSVDGEFVFDDTEAIVNNEDLRPETPVWNLFFNDFWGTRLTDKTSHKSYRPLTVLSFRWNYWLSGGLKPWGFHVTNIWLHALASVLLLPFCDILYGGRCPRASFLTALLFAVHPVHSEAVAGVVGRADLLCAVFFLLSFLMYCRAIHYKSETEKLWALFVSMVLCCISMLCKEQGITVLGLCSLYDVIETAKILPVDVISSLACKISAFQKSQEVQVETIGLDERKSSSNGRSKHLLKRHAILFVTGILLLLLRWKVMGSTLPTFQKSDNPASFAESFTARFLTYNYIYALNAWLLLCPEWLCFDWSMGCIPVFSMKNPFDYRIVTIVIFWTSLAVLLRKCFSSRNSRNVRCMILSLGLLVIPFLPASNIFFRVGFVVAERVLYLPSAGHCMLIVIGLRQLAQVDRSLARVGFLYLLIAFGSRATRRSAQWKTEEVLFESGLNVCPLNAKIHYNIAKKAGDAGHKLSAIAGYRTALRLNEEYDQAMNNLANMLRDEGQLNEAESLLRKAISLRNDFAAAWMNLGIVLSGQKRYQEAEECYITALKHRRKYPDCYYNLGNLYLELKKYNAAYEAWNNATTLKPLHSLAWNNMIIMLDNIGNITEAEVVGQSALSHLPHEPSLHFSLANTLGKSGKYEEAEKHFQLAIHFDSNNALYYSNLGVLYHRWKKYPKAETLYKIALAIDPTMQSTIDNLNVVRTFRSKQDYSLAKQTKKGKKEVNTCNA